MSLRDRVSTRRPWATARHQGWRYLLSLIVPTRMTSEYEVISDPMNPERDGTREHASWWQFRWKVYRHRRVTL